MSIHVIAGWQISYGQATILFLLDYAAIKRIQPSKPAAHPASYAKRTSEEVEELPATLGIYFLKEETLVG